MGYMPADDVVLLDTESIRALAPWPSPSADSLAGIVAERTSVKVRLLVLETDGGAELWSAVPTWLAVESRTDSELVGRIYGGGLDRNGYREGEFRVVPLTGSLTW